MRRMILLALSLAVMACSSETKEGESSPPISEDDAKAMKEGAVVETLADAPEGIELEGTQYITGRKWQDANGENMLLFSFSEQAATDLDGNKGVTRQLFTQLMNKKEGMKDYILTQHLEAHENVCGYQNMLYLNEESITIVDIDKDNKKEASYVYTQGCVQDDTENYPMKLKVLSYDRHYDMWGGHGQTGEKKANATTNDSKHFESSFDDAPVAIKTYASQLWDKYESK